MELSQNQHRSNNKADIMARAKNFQKISLNDDYRVPEAYKKGGFGLTDEVTLGKYRSAAKHMIALVGKKILTGHFNLTTVSFPIRCMQHQTILQVVASVSKVHPNFLTAAALATDPVERMKFIITDSIANIYPTH